MKIVHPLLACLLIFLTGCTSPPSLPLLADDDVVLAFGDSLTVGYGVSAGESYPAQLQGLISRRVVVAGASGETTVDALKRLPEILRKVRPALVIICSGGNDFLKKYPEKVTVDNLERMIQIVHDTNARVVVISVPRPSLWPSNHPLYAQLASAYDLWIEDSILKSVLHDENLKSDYLHPNAQGYRLIAEAVARMIASDV
jgi:lysophospholipase L1-like esterase